MKRTADETLSKLEDGLIFHSEARAALCKDLLEIVGEDMPTPHEPDELIDRIFDNIEEEVGRFVRDVAINGSPTDMMVARHRAKREKAKAALNQLLLKARLDELEMARPEVETGVTEQYFIDRITEIKKEIE